MNNENLAPAVVQRIMKEVRGIMKKPSEGIRLQFNPENISNIQADIEGPVDTPFQGGSFRCRLVLGPDFPNSPPKGYFMTKIFHPNVAPDGAICVNTLKKDWSPELGLKHVLLVIRCLLIYPNPESALNEEAGKMLLEAYDDYFKRAALWTQIHATPKAGAADDEAAAGLVVEEAKKPEIEAAADAPVAPKKAAAAAADKGRKEPAGKKKADAGANKKKNLRRL